MTYTVDLCKLDFPLIEKSCLNHSIYVPYNSEDEINDNGWGCAWRAIQTLISSIIPDKTKIPSFSFLFNTYGSHEKLVEIYKKYHNL